VPESRAVKTGASWLSRRWMPIAAGAMVLLYAVLSWLQRAPAVTTRNDDALYILLARSIQAGHYGQPFLVGAPPHLHYPPGFPGLLAVLSQVFGENLAVFAAANILLVAASLLLVADVVRRKWSPGLALAVLGLGVINPGLHNAGGRILSEALYLFLTVLALWAVTVKPRSGWLALVVGLAAVGAGLTRSVGVTLIAALVVHWLTQKEWRRALVLGLAGALTAGAWLVRSSGAEQGVTRIYINDMVGPVTGPLHSLGQRVIHHVVDYLSANIPFQMPVATVANTVLDNLLWLGLLVVLAVLGLWACWQRWRALFWYLLAYGGLLLVWRWVDTRYLIPATPMLHLLVVAGWSVPVAARWRLAVRVSIVVYCLAVVGGAWQQGSSILKRRLACDRSSPLTSANCFNSDQRSLFAGALFVRDSLPEETPVLSPKEATFAYYSQHKVLHPSNAFSESQDQDFLDQVLQTGVRHVFLDRIHPSSRRRIGRMLAMSCGRLRVVKAFPPKSFLFVISEASSDSEGSPGRNSACQALEFYNSETSPDPATPGWW